MIKATKRIAVIILAVFISILITQVTSSAEVPLKDKFTYGLGKNQGEEYTRWMKYPYYSSVQAEYDKNGYKAASGNGVISGAKEIKVESDSPNLQGNIGGRNKQVFVWEESEPWAEWEFNVPTEGLYQVEVEYFMLPGSGNPAVRSLMLDGQVPFIEANNIIFPRMWQDEGEPIINSIGDETRPGQVEISNWRKTRLCDSFGFYPEALKFYLMPGKHTFRLNYVDQAMAIDSIALLPAEDIPSYEKVRQEYVGKRYKEATVSVEFEAESNAIEKSDPTVRRETNGDPSVRPLSMTNRKLNVIGGSRWKKGNQSITWKFTVPEDGLYKIGVRERQNFNDGLPSFRQIALDGRVPFKEMEEYCFTYDRNWRLEELKDSYGEPFRFYLAKGEHTLTMTVKLGNLTPIVQSLNDDNLLLSNILRDIIKVTGSYADPNYDYELFETIPTLKGNLETLMESLQIKYDTIRGMPGKLPAMANNFMTIKSQLADMVKDPFSIAGRMNDLNNAQNSLGTWYLSMQNQPLTVDYFKIGAPHERWKNVQSGILSKLKVTLANFMVSFRKDYDNVGSTLKKNTSIKNSINVWVARGTEWAELIKEMADEDFTPETGIMVNINVLPASQLQAGNVNALMLSITSGRAPDVGIGVGSGDPVEFAIRDAVLDLSKFKDYDSISQRFIPNIIIPYRYRGGVYALPETMDFSVLFYRKDIVEDLGIKLPDTREELYSYVLPTLYQNGLQFNYPRDFTQFIFQHGGDYYSPDGKRSALDTSEAFQAFREYTELYTNYGIPVVANFFSRMRSGEMPMGIGSYATYMQFSVAAPELAGRWGIAPLPGIRKPDGTIDRSNGALAGQCDIILKQTKYPEESWEFLKWWTSTPVQTKFAREIEALVGAEARWNTANVEAFSNLAWKSEDMKVFKEQWTWAKETPVVLGGYFTGRYLTNAWNSVVISGKNLRDSLEDAVKEINRELRMKQEEYGVLDN